MSKQYIWKEELDKGCIVSRLYVDGEYQRYFLVRYHKDGDWNMYQESSGYFTGIHFGSNQDLEEAQSILIQEWEKQQETT